jgi:hypothetical protein
MSRNAFAQCERDYNQAIEHREQAAMERSISESAIIKPFRIPSGAQPVTDTAEGPVESIAVDGSKQSFWLVPKMKPWVRDQNGKGYPQRVDGRIVWAVPGGGSYVQNALVEAAPAVRRASNDGLGNE